MKAGECVESALVLEGAPDGDSSIPGLAGGRGDDSEGGERFTESHVAH